MKGLYGLIYAGRYNQNPVALKDIQALGQHSDEVLLKIKREAAIMSKNIVNFEGLNLQSGFIAMELAYCSLFNILHNKVNYATAFDAAAVSETLSNLTLYVDFANGVGYLNIQHRDLKTANSVMLSGRTECWRRLAIWHLIPRTGGRSYQHKLDSECQPSKISLLTCRRFLASIHGSNLELLGIGNNDDCGGSGDTGRTEIESASLFSYSSDICATGIVFNEIWTCMVPWSQLIHYSLIAPRVAKGKRPVLDTPKPD